MKKTTSLFVIAIFLFSLIPFAFAEEELDVNVDASVQVDAEARVSSSESDSGATTRGSGSIKPRVRADLREDLKDEREDIRDKKEDIRDASQIDRARCIQKCEASNGVNCEARCTVKDKQENAVDAREDFKDRMEDHREKNRERLMKIATLDEKQIEKLSNLEVKDVEKLAELKNERLQKIAQLNENHVKKLAELQKERLEKLTDLDKTDLEKLSVLGRAELDTLSAENLAKVKAELKTMHVVRIKNADHLAFKNLTEEEKDQLKERYEVAREKYKQSKDELKSIRDELKQAKEENNDEDVMQHAKEYIVRTADALIIHLEKIKIKVQESAYITDEKGAEITAEIDAQIGEIAAIKAEAQAATTKDQLKEAAKKLRTKWAKLKHWAKFYSERVISARVQGLINRGAVLEKKLEHIIERAENAGIEVDLSAEINDFSAKIALAKDKHSQGQAKLAEAWALKAKNESSEQVRILVEQANALFKESKEALEAAHNMLKDIVVKLKAAYPQANLSEEIEVEVVQETNTEASASV